LPGLASDSTSQFSGLTRVELAINEADLAFIEVAAMGHGGR